MARKKRTLLGAMALLWASATSLAYADPTGFAYDFNVANFAFAGHDPTTGLGVPITAPVTFDGVEEDGPDGIDGPGGVPVSRVNETRIPLSATDEWLQFSFVTNSALRAGNTTSSLVLDPTVPVNQTVGSIDFGVSNLQWGDDPTTGLPRTGLVHPDPFAIGANFWFWFSIDGAPVDMTSTLFPVAPDPLSTSFEVVYFTTASPTDSSAPISAEFSPGPFSTGLGPTLYYGLLLNTLGLSDQIDQINGLHFAFVVTHPQPAPEPSALLLLGFGLAATGLLRRAL